MYVHKIIKRTRGKKTTETVVSEHSGKQADSNQLRTNGGWGDP